jgi:hypothetical protein
MKKIAMTVTVMAILLAFGFAGSANAAGAYVGTGPSWSFPNFGGDLGDIDENSGFSWEYLQAGYNFTDNLGLNLLWGQAAGPASHGVDWTNDYIDLNFRYTFPNEVISPYLEAGLGWYGFKADAPGFDLESDPALGIRLGMGGIIPLSSSNFYIAPELSYHVVKYDKGDAHINGWGSGGIKDIGAGDFGLISLKIGYMFGK